MKKVLLLGSSGMAGQVLKLELLRHKDQINLVDVARNNKISKPSIELDVTDFFHLKRIIIEGNFDYIINCIGLLNSYAEQNPDHAILINSYLPHHLANLTANSKTKIIHLSTDCVFSGRSGGYIELDNKDGHGYYAQSKALGEIINDKDLTIRTSIIGPDKNKNGIGLFNWTINQTGKINGYKNAIWSGITTIQLAHFIIKLIISQSNLTGLIHLTNNNKISKHDLLVLIKNEFKLDNLDIVEFNNYRVDKSFLNTRLDIDYRIPSYMDMILELKYWIDEYNYY
jgi:dTDP-4-dehydrorhamnose reductase